ncbi:helix-turn-helix domain-containing protein [Marinifilum flexuosum]|uniref:Regulatory Fis family protein n=1 Tax=Marinifilum flexuosum TaxID=1117708 RepID=A0A419X9N4_9BACT|nr:helix-turn-helix domain-containing protein [Marinifilum flexuosum]RKE04442.1 regulatory Fis family protein [Marinifilum flexuosum]
MEYRTMNRKELAAELDISYATLYRRMKLLDPEFRKQIAGHSLLFENEVKYIHEQISGLKKWESGSK